MNPFRTVKIAAQAAATAARAGGRRRQARTLLDLALEEIEQKRFEQARELVEAVLEMEDEIRPPDWARVSDLCGQLAGVKRAAGEAGEARRLLEEAARAAERGFGAGHTLLGDCLAELGTLLQETGEPAAALDCFKRALEIHRTARGADSAEVVHDYERLAVAHHSLGQFEEAAEYYKKALYLRERQVGGDGSELTTLMVNLAQIYSDWGRYSPAMELLQQAVGRLEPSGDDRLARTLESLGALYARCGRSQDAARCYSRAHGVWEQAPGDHGSELERLSALLAVVAPPRAEEEAPPERVPTPLGMAEAALLASAAAPRAGEWPVAPGPRSFAPAAVAFAPAVEGYGAAAPTRPAPLLVVPAARRLHGWDELSFDLIPPP
jgi:tetratricopeptide (TPR) repeat protein